MKEMETMEMNDTVEINEEVKNDTIDIPVFEDDIDDENRSVGAIAVVGLCTLAVLAAIRFKGNIEEWNDKRMVKKLTKRGYIVERQTEVATVDDSSEEAVSEENVTEEENK